MGVTRWAAIGVILFVLAVAVGALLVRYSADAFDSEPLQPGFAFLDSDSHPPSRVHWVVGESRTFTAAVWDVSGPAMAAGGDAIRLVPGNYEGDDPCNDDPEDVQLADGMELVIHPCAADAETYIRAGAVDAALLLGTYRFEVHAAGTQAPAVSPSLVGPDQVAGVVPERISDTATGLHWEVPGYWGGQRSSYHIRRRQQGDGWDWTEVRNEPLHTRYLDTSGIEPGVAYEYQVRAIERVSVGEWSDVATAVLTAPNPPESLAVNEDTTTAALDLVVGWSAPSAGATPTGYGVERSVEHGEWATVHAGNASTTQYGESAAPGAHYCYRAWSANADGSSARVPLGGACITVPLPTPTLTPTPTPTP